MTESHFLPGTQIQYAWDSTSLGDFKKCPYFYYLTHIQGWQPKDENIHLRFGIEYHTALENYDKLTTSGLKHDDAVVEVVRELLHSIHGWDPDTSTKPGADKNRYSLLRTVIWYLDDYRDDAALIHIRPNGEPAVELSFKFEVDYGPAGWDQPYIICGHLDKLVEFNGELFALDHKTTTRPLTDFYWNQYEPNNQMSLYTWATKVVYDANIKGIIIDAARVDPDPTKADFGRRFTYRAVDQLVEWERDLALWLRLAEQYALSNRWPQNDTACDKYGGCRFRSICNKAPQVRERFLEADFVQIPQEERWNPLKIR